MQRLFLVLTVLAFLVSPKQALAQTQVCTQAYGGGVICGVHTPVETGLAENLGKVGIGAILTSGVFFYISKKIKQVQI